MDYYNRNKDKFRDYYQSKRLEKIQYKRDYDAKKQIEKMRKILCNYDVVIRPPNPKRKRDCGMMIKHGEFIISWD